MSEPRFIANAPATPDILYAGYCDALARWQSSKSERDLAVVRESYQNFAIVFLGEADAEPLITAAAERWGGAT